MKAVQVHFIPDKSDSMMLATNENCLGLGVASLAAVGMMSLTWADNRDTYLRRREPAPKSSASEKPNNVESQKC